MLFALFKLNNFPDLSGMGIFYRRFYLSYFKIGMDINKLAKDLADNTIKLLQKLYLSSLTCVSLLIFIYNIVKGAFNHPLKMDSFLLKINLY